MDTAAKIHGGNVAPESAAPSTAAFGSTVEALQEACFCHFCHCSNCQKTCSDYYLKFLLRTNLFPELLTRYKMCWLEFHFLSFPSAFPWWGLQWIMKWFWSGNTQRSQERSPVSVKHADAQRKTVWQGISKGHHPWNNWHLFQKLFICKPSACTVLKPFMFLETIIVV